MKILQIYRYSYLLFVLFNIPVAIGKNAQTWLVGRFLSGMSGSAFLSVAGGSVADLFRGYELSMPMAIYTASPFIGPVM
jgi:MFS family permease